MHACPTQTENTYVDAIACYASVTITTVQLLFLSLPIVKLKYARAAVQKKNKHVAVHIEGIRSKSP